MQDETNIQFELLFLTQFKVGLKKRDSSQAGRKGTDGGVLQWRYGDHGLLDGFLGRKRNSRRNPSSWPYCMMFPDSKNVILIKFLLRLNLVLKVA